MHKTLKNWLEELAEETIIVSSEDINEEANGNMVTFGINQNLLSEWEKGSVTEFLTSCSNLYSNKSNDQRMVFYSWFDEQAGQIRISAVNQKHGKLPFGCKLNKVDLEELVNGFYSNDSGLYSNHKLNIWQQSI